MYRQRRDVHCHVIALQNSFLRFELPSESVGGGTRSSPNGESSACGIDVGRAKRRGRYVDGSGQWFSSLVLKVAER